MLFLTVSCLLPITLMPSILFTCVNYPPHSAFALFLFCPFFPFFLIFLPPSPIPSISIFILLLIQSLESFFLSKYPYPSILNYFYTIELLKHDSKKNNETSKNDWYRSSRSTRQLRMCQMVTVVTRVKGPPRDLLWEWLIIPGRGNWNSEGN